LPLTVINPKKRVKVDKCAKSQPGQTGENSHKGTKTQTILDDNLKRLELFESKGKKNGYSGLH
jgi:hypothetical protein